MLHTWGPVVKLRNVARSVGLTRVLSRFRSSSSYEERFGKTMLGALRPGDTVWDVGANVGFYTEQFAKIVGDGGKVIAFEPVPSCYDQMAKLVGSMPNVRMVKAGLGSSSGTLTFDVGSADVTLGRVVEGGAAAPGAKLLHLPVYTGQDAVAKENLPAPTFVKVDVEGFELEVLSGMASLLREPSCRNVFVEIHFGILAKRGLSKAPDEIVILLRGMGYTIHWVDASHIHASRS